MKSYLLISAVLLAACSAAPRTGAAEPTAAPAATALPMGDSRPIDNSIAAVSMSNLSAGAKQALELCTLINQPALVAGMGFVARAREAGKYAPFHENTIELKNDAPAWVITTNRTIELAGAQAIEPTCVVIDGAALWFLASGALREGNVVQSVTPRNPPTLRLPPLEP